MSLAKLSAILAALFATSALAAAETPSAPPRPDAAPATGHTLEELALLAREHRELGDNAGALRSTAWKRLEKAQQHVLDGRIEEALDELAPLVRRSKRLDMRTLELVMRLHMHIASIEGNRGNPDAATRIYERLLPVLEKNYPPSMQATALWRLAQSTFLAGNYATSLTYLERWLPRSPIMAAACPAVCPKRDHPSSLQRTGT